MITLPVDSVFGRWTVTGPSVRDRHGLAYVPCRCECSTTRLVRRRHLIIGESQSCGCRLADLNRETKASHGHTRGRTPTREWRMWQRARQRHGEDRPFMVWLAETTAAV
jgi:hypothetical protein